IVGILSVFIVAVLCTSCNKEQIAEILETATSEDVADIENMMDDVENESDTQIDIAKNGGGGGTNGCPTFTWDQPQGTFPNTLTIDFGTAGCVGTYGRTRKGKIIIYMSDQFSIAGAYRTITLDKYSVNDISIEGSTKIVNNGNQSWTRTITNAQITKPNGDVVRSWDATRTLTMVGGMNTPNIRIDDVYEITGNSSGVNRNGKSFITNIVTPLVKERGCRWMVEGVVDHTVDAADGRSRRRNPAGAFGSATAAARRSTRALNGATS
ncbi:MAG: hypothetical protein AAF360_15270, partial [Pseudomonadota bacterium]